MAFDLSHPNRTIHAGVILTKGNTEMMDVAPFEYFAWLDKRSLYTLGFPDSMSKDGLDFQLHWVTEDGGEAQMKSGARIQPTDSFQSCPPLDIALMGAHAMGYTTTEAEKAFIRKSYDDCSAFLTVCGGVIPAVEAGLLSGKTACAPRMALRYLRETVPDVNWADKRWIRDGKFWSSSTLVNGTDLIRGFATEVWGGEGRSGFAEGMLDALHFPDRDVDFKDYRGEQYDIVADI